ncbi:FtsW/RodA/SpoVE family cell cycle protein [Clostridium tagluense]|uniref:FtsW/RodA/SpoVE family cell cycle protein n=1 Tax=Clostridium tagluense TaxID=360422 RepID=UPI001CF3F6C1|nr:FtsW/RodA/SpoVE family cell cycle protein [Clostridium tagluense]MCB2312922.1 FtsW/RodA/SpoVE family cell cycle protein [Clostridium tagluense]MCB2317688.1 FtsW/RodA/SpoVE family cell cycle protein [Clostridium tagluense]MCB2322478.1 FtsW/RodA/SpoVE family cell cycle protein [Clostridium tagluense]MCB2327480.1 FtsW/RodA/SpoVE family cell cycle protein [Clostridium tagluense]MCB2332199.1 FtsW/RodA/SpoVE family cell cycle protein [Clostridium tagluense]
MGVGDNSKINEYIDYVCSYVKYKEAHKEIKAELSSHIEDIVDEYAESGMSQEEAGSKAISRMGDSDIVGKQLNIAHKGTPDWITLILTIVLVNTGVVLMYLMQYKSSYRSSDYLFNHSFLYAAIGTIGIVLLYFFDYRKLQKHSNYIFIGMCLLFILSFFIGQTINGAIFIIVGSFSFNIKAISLYVFVIALAGIFNNYDWNKKINLIKATGYLGIPMFFMFSAQGLSYCGIYFIAFIVLALKSNMKKKYAIYIVALNTFCVLFYFWIETYRMQRFLVFLDPFSDPEGAGYLGVQMYNITHTSGIFGHGFSANEKLLQVPELQSDFIFNYIVHTFGWLGAAVIITLIISFIYRMLHISKYVRDNYGRLLISGLISIFIVQFASNILMNVNLFPIMGIALPFISYGGSLGLINMLSVGIIMSVYRRRSLSN